MGHFVSTPQVTNASSPIFDDDDTNAFDDIFYKSEKRETSELADETKDLVDDSCYSEAKVELSTVSTATTERTELKKCEEDKDEEDKDEEDKDEKDKDEKKESIEPNAKLIFDAVVIDSKNSLFEVVTKITEVTFGEFTDAVRTIRNAKTTVSKDTLIKAGFDIAIKTIEDTITEAHTTIKTASVAFNGNFKVKYPDTVYQVSENQFMPVIFFTSHDTADNPKDADVTKLIATIIGAIDAINENIFTISKIETDSDSDFKITDIKAVENFINTIATKKEFLKIAISLFEKLFNDDIAKAGTIFGATIAEARLIKAIEDGRAHDAAQAKVYFESLQVKTDASSCSTKVQA
jgi:hypothetical protein